MIRMTDLLHKCPAVNARGTAVPPPREYDHQGQPTAEPEKCRLSVGDEGIAGVLTCGSRCRDRHLREVVEER